MLLINSQTHLNQARRVLIQSNITQCSKIRELGITVMLCVNRTKPTHKEGFTNFIGRRDLAIKPSVCHKY